MSQKKKYREFNYYNDTYQTAYKLWIGDAEDLEKSLGSDGSRPNDPVDINAYAETRIVRDHSGRSLYHLIYLRQMEFTSTDYATLAHECHHAASMTLFPRGIEEKNTGVREAEAYLMAAIYTALLDKLHVAYKRAIKSPAKHRA